MSFPRTALALFVLVLSLVGAAPARAQDDGPFREAGPFALPVTRRGVDTYTKMLGFDRDEAAQARTLYDGYRAAFKSATDKARRKDAELMEKAQEKGDWAAMRKDQGKIALAYIDEVEGLEKGLFADIKTLCTPQQAERFAAVERARRRETGFRLSLASGEAIDLVSMLEQLKIDRRATPALDEVVTRWETDVDRLLLEKDRVMREGMKSVISMDMDERGEKQMQKFIGDLFAVSARVRDVAKAAAREVEPLLPEDKRAAFAAEVKVRTYPRIYGPSRVTKALDAAEAMKDVTGDQKSQLASLRESYTREAEGVNARWAAAAEEKQSKMSTDFIRMMEDNDEEHDPFFIIRKERRALDKRYEDRIAQVLNQDQRDRIPKGEPQGRHGGDPEFLPDFDGDMERTWDEWQKEE